MILFRNERRMIILTNLCWLWAFDAMLLKDDESLNTQCFVMGRLGKSFGSNLATLLDSTTCAVKQLNAYARHSVAEMVQAHPRSWYAYHPLPLIYSDEHDNA